MRKLLLAALAVIFVTPAFAIDGLPNNVPVLDTNGKPLFITRVFGERTTMAATWDEIDFGFQSDYVTICVHANTHVPVYFRFGDTLSGNATTDALFQNGSDGMPGRAGIIFPINVTTTAAATEDVCMTNAWRVQGIVLHVENTSGATIDVNAYGH